MSEFAYWLLESAAPEPLIVLAAASGGSWVQEFLPEQLPPLPIEFFSVRAGHFGPILHAHGLVLFRDDLLAAVREHCASVFAAYDASIGPPQSSERRSDYSVIKTSRLTSFSELHCSLGAPTLSALSEAPGHLVVSSELRELLEESGVHGLRFAEPLFAA